MKRNRTFRNLLILVTAATACVMPLSHSSLARVSRPTGKIAATPQKAKLPKQSKKPVQKQPGHFSGLIYQRYGTSDLYTCRIYRKSLAPNPKIGLVTREDKQFKLDSAYSYKSAEDPTTPGFVYPDDYALGRLDGRQ